MSTTTTPLLPGNWYHIYNRGINGETIYHTEANYQYFLELLDKYVLQTANVYAYCLMKNHFHLLVSIREDTKKKPHLHFSNLFNSYAQAINKQIGRHGSLFERPFRRKVILSDEHRMQVIFYIHSNPRHHGVMHDFTKYPYSSYNTMLRNSPTILCREDVMTWFGGRESFIAYHQVSHDDLVLDFRLE